MLNFPRRSECGFTLIELVGAIMVIGVLGLGAGQAARLNVVFLPAVQKSVPAQCTATLKIFDDAGNPLAQATALLLPNQSSSLVFQPDPTAVEIHAVVAIPTCPNNADTCSASDRALQNECRRQGRKFIGTLEIFDPASGKTQVVLPAVQMG
jgi:prepilin-type N-terminal cleavage/methylation domain-containing protein